MTRESPPPFAIRSLEWFLPSDERDALIGDLIEQYARRRSNGWFWQQALGALARQLAREIGSDGFEVVRMMAVAFLLMWGLFEAFNLGACAAGAVATTRIDDLVKSGTHVIPAAGRSPSGVVLIYLVFYIGGTLQAVLSGSFLVRWHPDCRPATIALVSVAAVLLFRLEEGVRLMQNVLTHPRINPYTVFWMLATTVWTFAWFLGARRGRRNETHQGTGQLTSAMT